MNIRKMTVTEFEIMAQRLRGHMLSVAKNLLASEDDASDAVQDTMMKLWLSRDRLEKARSVDALCITICRNLCIDRLRTTRRIFDNDIPDIADGALSALDMMMTEENERLADEIIASLPDRLQLIIRMRHMEGLEISRIAKITGSTESAIRVQLSRARRRIKDMFVDKDLITK